YNFTKKNLAKFAGILKNKQYDIVFFRFASTTFLTPIVEKTLPKAAVIIDVDMLFSRLAKLSWKINPTLKNRYYLIEFIKHKNYEFELFARPYLFYFTNYKELKLAQKLYVSPSSEAKLELIPNVMKPGDKEIISKKENYIIFFGDLKSAANRDAFLFLAKQIYPLIVSKLQQKGIKLKIVGKNQLPIYEEIKQKMNLHLLDLVGEVDDIKKYIATAKFAVFPIRIASGTRTRILEAAQLKTAVITTSLGAEGFRFSKDELLVADVPERIAENILNLLQNNEKCQQLAENLNKKAKKLYLDAVVAQKMVKSIKNFIGK
ncbi:MAG: glycosyltransferase, partial [Candidatus Cloacimonadota bacterium]|nr:glycosyltransferase [Candidatus Cloacimonadota bacterium]